MSKSGKGLREFPNRCKPSEHYDEVFNTQARYNTTPQRAGYFRIWKRVITLIKPTNRCADFGCATGQFAELLIECGGQFILGVDFSLVAIQKAKKRLPKYATCFHVGDLHDTAPYKLASFDTAVFLETLEHVRDDLQVLKRVPRNTKVILTVPSYSGRAHARTFSSVTVVTKRYRDLLNIKVVEAYGKTKFVWLVAGRRR